MPWPFELCKQSSPFPLSDPIPILTELFFPSLNPNPYFPPRRSRRDRFLNPQIHSELQVLRGDYFLKFIDLRERERLIYSTYLCIH